ncbi:dTDP-4-dehydrorhamnose 3,5-epimerase [Klebsiella pneumoniae]|uniref:dTDP-4-dehydrorhamnose 3,5-epimerase n=1 Tax=Klebsiella pneumoniae TaxID=573 RepID=UPI000E2DA26E|nr:dTDP-4-dehydrorhamnose 3,5-epimerase [Klebsiella pneumoniae]SWC31366.1 dTDP-4-dehydrorhamnose 3,5-epimerase [Klebsiella pneumoniae]
MNIIKTDIPEVLIFEPRVFGDARGFFFESFSSKVFNEAVGRQVDFVQDNHSQSQKGVLRGLHYQLDPHAQGKLVRCVEGEVFDVGAVLSAENKRQLWIPEGFAHGFMALSDTVQFVYKATNYYAPQSERSIIWNDPEIGIDWPALSDSALSLSEKDLQAHTLATAEVYK